MRSTDISHNACIAPAVLIPKDTMFDSEESTKSTARWEHIGNYGVEPPDF